LKAGSRRPGWLRHPPRPAQDLDDCSTSLPANGTRLYRRREKYTQVDDSVTEPAPDLPRPRPRQALQQRVAAAIVEAAAHALARHAGRASIGDVAAEAGVARTTVYRYFTNRQVLLEEVAKRALAETGERLTTARIDEVAVVEGVTRAIRALVDVGDLFIVVERERPDPAEFDRVITAPIRELLERGQEGAVIRSDVPSSALTQALVGLTVTVARSATLGKEDRIAAIGSLFLEGARIRSAQPVSELPQ
jgi:TetR/AcrR family transcriptional regulator, mexCD-oprJ operon repressor